MKYVTHSNPRSIARTTFRKSLDGDVVELLLLFHDECVLVDLDDERSTPLAPPCEAKFAEGILEGLGYINCVRLSVLSSVPFCVRFAHIELTIVDSDVECEKGCPDKIVPMITCKMTRLLTPIE